MEAEIQPVPEPEPEALVTESHEPAPETAPISPLYLTAAESSVFVEGSVFGEGSVFAEEPAPADSTDPDAAEPPEQLP